MGELQLEATASRSRQDVLGHLFGMNERIKIVRGLRFVVLLNAIFIFGTWPFITYLALYQVSIVNNFFAVFTVPTLDPLQLQLSVAIAALLAVRSDWPGAAILYPAGDE